MNIHMDATLGLNYHSSQQQARVITETWAAENMYCVMCGEPHLEHLQNNKPVADLFCPNCQNTFELKSHNGHYGSVIADGAYETMMARLMDDNNPHLFVMEYKRPKYIVENLWVIPSYFFTTEIIIKRKPLPPTARRAGWTGCNIAWKNIPAQGKIPVIFQQEILDPNWVREKVSATTVLATTKVQTRGWLMDVLYCLEQMGKEYFTLRDVYGFTDYLQERHKENHNIQPKIRQQLQFLRDKGFVEFLSRGEYRLKNND